MVGKRVQFDDETWAAVDLLAKDSMRDFQELAEEAFRDLLAKHGRVVGLKDQLKAAARDANHEVGKRDGASRSQSSRADEAAVARRKLDRRSEQRIDRRKQRAGHDRARTGDGSG